MQGAPFLDASKVVELAVAEFYSRELREPMFVVVGRWDKFDAVNLSKSLAVEVKFDCLAAATFNLCLEIECCGRPSGLAATRADRWVSVVPRGEVLSCCEFRVDVLRRAVEPLPVHSGGDGGRSRFKLLPLSIASRIMLRVFRLHFDWPRRWAEEGEAA